MPTDKKSIEVTILTSKKIKEKNPNITSPLILKYKSSLSLQDILTEVNKKLGLSGKEGFKLCAATGRGRELADNDELNSCISNGKCRLRFVQDVNDVCMGIMSTAPEKPRFKEGATCDYSLLSAVAELLDNSIEAVMRNGMDEKTIVICFNVIDKTFSIHDNGVGCEDPERLLRYGSEKAEVSDRYNPKCKTFDRYTCGMFSRYGVGSKKAGHSLGIIINIASKVKGSSLIHSTTDRDEEKWEAESFEQYIDDDDDEISKSYCKIDIDQFKTSLLTTGGSSSTLQGWEEVVNNLGMIYFMFLGDKMPGYHFVARKILKLLDDTCVHREGLNKIRMNTKPEVKRMEDDKRKLQEAMRGCKRAKTSPRLNISCKLIYPDATGLRQEVEASLSKSISCLNTLLSDAAVDCFPIHIELEKGNVDQQEGGSIAMGALFYFPNKDNKETIQYVDRFFGHSSGEDRRFLVFWMGRLLLADQFMPEFMKKDLAESKVPVKCLKRTFGILFLDRGIEPKSNKTSLSDNVNGQDSYLDQLRKALNDTKLVNAYHLWLRLCHRKYDDELTFEDEPTYCEKEGMFVHQKINYCGNEYKIGDYIELSEGDEFKRSKQPKNVKVGQVVKFLKATNDHEGCKGKVVCRVLEKNNRLEEDQRFEIPDWSMKRLSDEDFEARKEKNKCSIVHRVQFVNASKKFTAGDSTSPFQLKCLNHLGKSITVEPECDLIVTPEGGEDQRFKLRYTFSPFLPDADFLQKAGQYTVRAVQQQDSSNPLICDPFRFTIHPGDVKDVELQLEDRDLVKMEHGKESSFKVTLYDEYKNTIPPKVSHKPKIEVASGLVKLDVEHTFEGYAMQMKIVRVESEKCGRFSAKLVVMRDDGEGKETHFNIEISHGAAQSLQVEQSEGLELINRSVLPELTCVVQDGFGNRCTRVDDAILYLTSADLHFADCFISGKVNHGKHTFQTDKQVQSLYFLSPESGQKEATRCSVVRSWDLTKRNRDESGVELEETWNELIAKQLKPIGFLNPFHGFFCVGDWVEVLFKLKTGRNEYHPGRIESVCKEQGGNTWRIKYFKRSDSSRLLLPLPDASEVLDPMSLHRRIFVLHESLKDSLDPRALSDSVYFAPCDDCPRQLGASLDVFSHSRDQLLHRRVSMALKRSGSPCNFSICQGGEDRETIEAEHDAAIADLHLKACDEALLPCSGDVKVQVRCNWSQQQVLNFKPGHMTTLQLPQILAKKDDEYKLTVKYGQTERQLSFKVKVRREDPARLKLEVEGNKPIVVGEPFTLLGTVCDRNGNQFDNLRQFEFDFQTSRLKFETDARQEIEVKFWNNNLEEILDGGQGNFALHNSHFVLKNVVIECKATTGKLMMEMTIRPASRSDKCFLLRALEHNVDLKVGKPYSIVVDKDYHTSDLFPLEIPYNAEYACDIRFKLIDRLQNNLSDAWDTVVKANIGKRELPALEKWREEGREVAFRLTHLPPLPKGKHNMTVQVESMNVKILKPLELRVIAVAGNTVKQLELQVDERTQKLAKRESGKLDAEFTARIIFHTEDGKPLKDPNSEIPDVKLCMFGSRRKEEVATTFGKFDGKQLECKFFLDKVGWMDVKAEFKDSRPCNSSTEQHQSNKLKLKVEPGPVASFSITEIKLVGGDRSNEFTFNAQAVDGNGNLTSFHDGADWKMTITLSVLEEEYFAIEADPIQLSSSSSRLRSRFKLIPVGEPEGGHPLLCNVNFNAESNFDLAMTTCGKPVNLYFNDTATDSDMPDVDAGVAQEEEEARNREKEISESENEIASCKHKIAGCLQKMPLNSFLSNRIQEFSRKLNNMEDVNQRVSLCEEWISVAQGCMQHNEEETSRINRTVFPSCKHEANVPRESSSNCLGCVASLFLIDDRRALELQTAMSTAFGFELSTLVFASRSRMNDFLDKVARRPNDVTMRALCLEGLNEEGLEAQEVPGALGRASKFVRPTAEVAGLSSLARRFFDRLVVFDEQEKASSYRAARGELAVGLDAPNDVLTWDGTRIIGRRVDDTTRNVLGVANDWRSRTQQALKHEYKAAESMENLLQEIKGHCTKIVQEEKKIRDLKSLQNLSTSISVGDENGCKNTPKRDARHMVEEDAETPQSKRPKSSLSFPSANH